MKTIEKSVDINAIKEKVWEILFQEKYNREWYKAFHESAHAITDWQLGSKVIFSDDDGNGLVGHIRTRELYKALVIEYSAELIKGEEMNNPESGYSVQGGKENYFLSEQDGYIHLDVSTSGIMPDEFVEMMSKSWDEALIKIKQMSESN